MAQIPNLDNAPLNLRSLREQSQTELVNILKNIRGKKCLVIDPKLSGSLSVIIQTSLLKEHGVELRHLSAEPIQTDSTKVVYLVWSQLSLMKYISSHVSVIYLKVFIGNIMSILSPAMQLVVRRSSRRKISTTC